MLIFATYVLLRTVLQHSARRVVPGLAKSRVVKKAGIGGHPAAVFRPRSYLTPSPYLLAMHCRSDTASSTQASRCCCGILPRSIFSCRFFEEIRPRHFRKLLYQSRLHEGNVALAEARKLFNAFQRSLSHDTWRGFENELFRLEEQRQMFRPFSDYHHPHAAQREAVSRAKEYRRDANNLLVIVKERHAAWNASLTTQQARSSRRNVRSPMQGSYVSPVSRPHTSKQIHPTFSSLTSVYEPEPPLQTVQTRAAPIAWTPSPSHNALDLVLGPRQSPRPRVMTPSTRVRDSPDRSGSPWTPASSLHMGAPLTSFSPSIGGWKSTPSGTPSSLSHRNRGSGSRPSTGIRSATELPPVMESPTSCSPVSISSTGSRHAGNAHATGPGRYRPSPAWGQQATPGSAGGRRQRDFRSMEIPSRASTLPQAHLPSNNLTTFTP
ncbi:hypothetical protein C8Q73DRAFT_68958 [Cubamyces lactineus]|nr:hypothetical protein C8Q73DRAFT_68958 [Cubamyces lactineus]